MSKSDEDSRKLRRSRPKRIGRSRIAFAGVGALLAILTGCGEMRYEYGRSFSTEPLETTLIVGQSSEEDVRRALGEPDGVGRYLAPVRFESDSMWTYYHETGTATKQAERTMLFVLFRDQRYDGYLWFADTLNAASK